MITSVAASGVSPDVQREGSDRSTDSDATEWGTERREVGREGKNEMGGRGEGGQRGEEG